MFKKNRIYKLVKPFTELMLDEYDNLICFLTYAVNVPKYFIITILTTSVGLDQLVECKHDLVSFLMQLFEKTIILVFFPGSISFEAETV